MPSSEEKAGKFIEAITRYAQEQRERIHQEVENFKQQRLQEAEQNVLRDAYRLIQAERREASRRLSREVSEQEAQTRRRLLVRRCEMVQSIEEDAREQVRAFTKTPAYVDWLKRSLQAMSARLPSHAVYELSRRDEPLRDALQPLLPKESTLKAADDIRLGGLRGSDAAGGILLDDTLDTRFAQAREAFIAQNRLPILPEGVPTYG